MFTTKDHERMAHLIHNAFRFRTPGAYISHELAHSEVRMTKKNVDLYYRVLSDLITGGRIERRVIQGVASYRWNV